MSEKLKLCPLCNGEAEEICEGSWGTVECQNPKCGIKITDQWHAAADRWNALPRKEVATSSLVLAVPQWTRREVREQYEQLSAEADRIAATFQRELEGALAPYHSRMTRMVEVGTAPTILVKR
jgi:hypothetical protein